MTAKRLQQGPISRALHLDAYGRSCKGTVCCLLGLPERYEAQLGCCSPLAAAGTRPGAWLVLLVVLLHHSTPLQTALGDTRTAA